ncbi:cation-translocating P-type ATPase [Geomonas sp. RF6]|uniref:cation-translocating P-type ATPase n=1 Tax=Geomonas sp. RF6 TaxID=2897342 RepID=UPI001E635E32|nr:cation-translocating P-type ATPase [Geomonas sp. RF6]UFS71963.1 cation-translocating P-type ATPase [Geomonas sp. RF6]
MEWYQLQLDQVFNSLESTPTGLSSAEAAKRLALHGPNLLTASKRKTPLLLFLNQFKDFLIVVLIVAAVVAGAIRETVDSVVILAIVVVNAVIGFLQEYRAERAMEALKQMAAPQATAVRDGSPSIIAAAELVLGDVVLLEAGDMVAADLRLLEATRLTVVEAALTGESVPILKDAIARSEGNLPLGDRKNLCFKGTVVTNGKGRGMVVATGMQTELGKIAKMLEGEEALQTPLQRRLELFGHRVCLAILAVCLVFFCAGLLKGEDLIVMLLTAISLAVAAIPEALPAVVSVSLALGARRLAGENALVRHLSAVETLGSVTHICTDKTGTLTVNRMTVQEIYTLGKRMPPDESGRWQEGEKGESLWAAMALCHEVRIGSAGEMSGDPTEVALVAAARDHGVPVERVMGEHPKCAELPFDAQRKLMTTVHPWANAFVSFTKGAPEAVLPRCTAVLTAAGLASPDRDAAGEAVTAMTEGGLRVLALAMRRLDAVPAHLVDVELEGELTLLGLVGMMDPPREEVHDAVALCRMAGILPVMITGDHPQTACTIGRRLGIMNGSDLSTLMSGDTLAALPMKRFREAVETVRVYARCAPEQKLKIVKALQEQGGCVAMTGDGVNDAPALKRADIGVAMGGTGTDVAKESADLILLDDNFATIVKAVGEGRRIYDNIRKFIKYLLTTNSGEIVVVAAAPFIGLPMPLVPVQILWVNLMTDALPALALSLESAEGDVMARPPRPPQESIFAHGLGLHVILVGLLIGVLVLGIQAWSLRRGDVHWQTMTFTVLCFTQLFHVLAIRSERQSLFTMGVFSNKALLGAVLISLILQLAIVYLPPLNPIFKTLPMDWEELAVVVAVSSVVFFAVELEKMVRRSRDGNADRR